MDDLTFPDKNTWSLEQSGGWSNGSTAGFGNQIWDFFTGENSRLSAEYDKAYNAFREDTQYQRMVKDLEAAGINPWIAFSNGGSGNASYFTPTSSNQNNDKVQTLRNLMTTLFLIARIAGM